MAAIVTKMIENMVNSAVDNAVGKITDKMCLEIEKKMPEIASRIMLSIEKRVDTKAFTDNIQKQFVDAANTARTTSKPLIVSDNNAQATGSIPSTSISGVASETTTIPKPSIEIVAKPESNAVTATSGTSLPTSLPEGWNVYTNPENGKIYYHNRFTDKSQDDKPVKDTPEYNKLGGRRLTISKKRPHKKTVKRRRKCRS